MGRDRRHPAPGAASAATPSTTRRSGSSTRRASRSTPRDRAPPPRRRRARQRPRAPARPLGPGERPRGRDRRRRAGRDRARHRARPGRLARRARSRRGTRRVGSASASASPGARGFAEANALVDDVELVILAVPDDAIVEVAAVAPAVRGPGHGPHERRARRRGARGRRWPPGTQAGAFHPLVAFADLDRALAALPGATIAIEGDEELAAHLAEMAEAIGAVPVRLPAGLEGRLPRGGGARGRRRRRACSTRSARSPALARPRRGGRARRSTCRSLEQARRQRARARASARRSPARPSRGDVGHGRGAPRRAAGRRAGRPGGRTARCSSATSAIAAGRGALSPESAERLQSRTCRPSVTR